MSIKPGDWWDVSWNPIEGCTPISEACENCWALTMLKRFRGMEPGEIKFYPERLEQPARWKKPRRIFVGSLTDMFLSHGVAMGAMQSTIRHMLRAPQHEYYFLTKRPGRMKEWLPGFLDLHEKGIRFALGVTAENQARFDERVPDLMSLSQWFRTFVSLEPLLGPIDLKIAPAWLDWVIVGGETGPHARPMRPDWVRRIRNQCQKAGVPFWFKGWGRWVTERQAPEDAVMPAVGHLPLHGKGPTLFALGSRSGRLFDGKTHEGRPPV